MTELVVQRAGDPDLAPEIAALVNEVYAEAEKGLWRNTAARTTAAEVAQLIEQGHLVTATAAGAIVGTVRVHDAEFGMLAAAPTHRNLGVGRTLLNHIEQEAAATGHPVMRLEILVPQTWTHPSKAFLKDWYARRGYRLVTKSTLDAAYPHLAPHLATPCDLEIHEKRLKTSI